MKADYPREDAVAVSTELGTRLHAALRDSYDVREELATGGMATVFLAKEVQSDGLVALKVLRPEMAKTLGTQRFRHEIALGARLRHKHILPVLDHGEASGDLLWYSMPYVRGETLRARLTREPQMPLGEALRVTREVASALDYAHGAGYMHRDVKPDNIFVADDSETLLADFGIARAVRDASGNTRASVSDVDLPTTTTGFVVGSPQYMSPEAVGGDPSIDGRTDQYSLGVVLYEMLAGEAPFGGRNPQAVVAKMFASATPSVRVVRAEVPVEVDEAIRRALSRSRNDRFQTMSDFASALQIASSDARAGSGGAMSKLASRLRAWRTQQ